VVPDPVAEPRATRALALHGLRKVYRGGVEALRGIDLEVEAGDFFALLGPNGAGKTTAIGIVCALVRRTSGRVTVFGSDLDRDWARVRACIGLMPQEHNFNIWEPAEEILINQAGYYGVPRREAYQRAEAVLGELGLWSRRRDQARSLSGGMKRRLMLARALVHRPRLLILDEPTAGVDIEVRRSIWALLRRVNAEGTTIILTTHYLEEAESLCRNLAIIHRGAIVAHSAMGALLRQLHRETFVLSLREPLAAAPVLPGYAVRRLDAHTLEVDVDQAQGVNRLFAGLTGQGVEVVSLRNKVNRLEELFLRLVDERPEQA
jgi:ABC-2 type transport system ATP-binding protein